MAPEDFFFFFRTSLSFYETRFSDPTSKNLRFGKTGLTLVNWWAMHVCEVVCVPVHVRIMWVCVYVCVCKCTCMSVRECACVCVCMHVTYGMEMITRTHPCRHVHVGARAPHWPSSFLTLILFLSQGLSTEPGTHWSARLAGTTCLLFQGFLLKRVVSMSL